MAEQLKTYLVTDPERKIGELDAAHDLYIQNERVGFIWLDPHKYRFSLKAALDFSKLDNEVLNTLPASILMDRDRTKEVDLENIHEFTIACLLINNDEDGTDMFEDRLSVSNQTSREAYKDAIENRQISFARFDVDINKGQTRLKYTVTSSNPEVALEPIDMDFLCLQIPLAYGFGDNLANWVWEHHKFGYEVEKEDFVNILQQIVKNYILSRNNPRLQ